MHYSHVLTKVPTHHSDHPDTKMITLSPSNASQVAEELPFFQSRQYNFNNDLASSQLNSVSDPKEEFEPASVTKNEKKCVQYRRYTNQ